MKKSVLATFAVSILLVSIAAVYAAGGFDEYGYNTQARNFVGTCVGWYEGKYGGDGTAYCGIYSDDQLKMKWNAEWDRGNDEGWSDPKGYDAWLDNQWNGMFPGGSGETWHYMFKWDAGCKDSGVPSTEGGYCIWGQFVVTSSHGTAGGEHFWDTHALPTGYGA